ncbi:MAG: YqgE/AlgH family protein, partial [Pseudomonadota bacterium]
KEATLVTSNDVCLTATVEILRAIASGGGPEHALLALGYAGWAPGQLENEISNNGWLHCEADHDLLFEGDLESRYERAIQKLGFDPALLSSVAGHA